MQFLVIILNTLQNRSCAENYYPSLFFLSQLHMEQDRSMVVFRPRDGSFLCMFKDVDAPPRRINSQLLSISLHFTDRSLGLSFASWTTGRQLCEAFTVLLSLVPACVMSHHAPALAPASATVSYSLSHWL